MSFGEINTDAVRGSIEDASAGPRLGFQDAMVAAWDATTKAHSLLAVEQGMRAIEQAQIKKIQAAGLRAPNSLDDSEDVQPILGADNSDRNPLATTFRQGRYSAAAQSIIDGGGWYTDEMVAQRDEHLKRLQAERPDLGIQTYTDMFKQVQKDAQDAEQRSQLPKTLGGHIGAFIGEAGGTLDPSSNPLNFATGAVGGGEGVIGRAVVQGAVQATAEAGNLAASDPESILLGKQRTPGEDVGRIAMAGVAGAGADLLLSGAGAAIRRMRTGKWFNDVPLPDPPKPAIEPSTAQTFQGAVPPPMKPGLPLHEYPDWETFARAHGEEPNVYGPSPEAKPRTAADLNYVATELNKWDGPAPWELRPPSTDVALPRPAEPGVEINIAPSAYTRYLDNLETVHDIARRIDPETFRAYDTLQQQIQDLRGSIETDKQGPSRFFEGEEAARQQRELSMRQQIQKYDQQMRDMAPLVSRAYGLAEKEWRTTPLDHNTIEFFKSIEESGAQWRYRPGKSFDERANLFVRPSDIGVPRFNETPAAARERVASAPKLREAKSFTDWFKGSKALDPDGQPAIVYHGTDSVFDTFDVTRGGQATGAPSAKEGIFFASDTAVANSYAKRYDPYKDDDSAIGKFVRIINKLSAGYYEKFNEWVLNAINFKRDVSSPNIRPAYLKMHDPLVVDYKGAEFREETYFNAIKRAKAEGKDGVIFKNTFDPGFNDMPHGEASDVFVVFKPEQIKAFSERYESAPSLTEQPPRIQTKAEPVVSPKTVDDAVPLASMEPGIDNRLHVDTDTAVARVKQNVAHTIEKLDEKVEQFATHAEKLSKLEAKDIAEQSKALEEKLAALRAERSATTGGPTKPEITITSGRIRKDVIEFGIKGYAAENGLGARVTGDTLAVGSVRLPTELQGKGYGVALYERAIEWANDHGLEFISDNHVSVAAGRVYTALEKRGYKVIRQPGTIEKDGVLLHYDDEGFQEGPVFVVQPPTKTSPKANVDIRTRMSETIAKVEKQLDELHYVTFPDGRKLHLDNDRAPFVHDDGRVEEMSVRDFMREMAKDQDALNSVVTCQRPS